MLKTTLSASALSFALLSGVVSAATVADGNGGFEDTTFVGSFTTLSAGSTSLTGWSIDSGSVDLINNYWDASEGSYSIDLSGNGPATISTTVSGLNQGSRYVLSFDVAANPDGGPEDKTLTALIAGLSATVTSLQSQGLDWITYTLTFTASDSDHLLTFSNANARTNNTSYGAALDNVSVAAVPLPAGGLLLLGALGGFAALRRRKKV